MKTVESTVIEKAFNAGCRKIVVLPYATVSLVSDNSGRRFNIAINDTPKFDLTKAEFLYPIMVGNEDKVKEDYDLFI